MAWLPHELIPDTRYDTPINVIVLYLWQNRTFCIHLALFHIFTIFGTSVLTLSSMSRNGVKEVGMR